LREPMKIGWGVGTLIAVLLSAAVFLFGLLDFIHTVSLVLLLSGLWTLVFAFAGAESKDRSYYSGWGLVVAILSLFAYIPFDYAIGLILIGIIALIIVSIYLGKSPKVYTAATAPPSHAGETPAANAR
jgi:hypothetical protein